MWYHIFFTIANNCLVGFLTSSSATSLSLGWVPRLTSDNFKCCHTEIEWGGGTMTSVSASHIILTTTQTIVNRHRDRTPDLLPRSCALYHSRKQDKKEPTNLLQNPTSETGYQTQSSKFAESLLEDFYRNSSWQFKLWSFNVGFYTKAT